MGIESSFPYWDNLIKARRPHAGPLQHRPGHRQGGRRRPSVHVRVARPLDADRGVVQLRPQHPRRRPHPGDGRRDDLLPPATPWDTTTRSRGAAEVGAAKVWATAIRHTASTYSEPLLPAARAGRDPLGRRRTARRLRRHRLEPVPEGDPRLGAQPADAARHRARQDGPSTPAGPAGPRRSTRPTGRSRPRTPSASTPAVRTAWSAWRSTRRSPRTGTSISTTRRRRRSSIVRVSRFPLHRPPTRPTRRATSRSRSPHPWPSASTSRGNTGGYLDVRPERQPVHRRRRRREPERLVRPRADRRALGPRPLRRPAHRANTNDLRGKILRGSTRSPTGRTRSRAATCSAQGTANTRPEIYAMGFRNPFRFAVNKENGWISMADYGPDAGSANSSRGPAGIVEYNLIKSPGFYGWPYCTGNNTLYNDFNFADQPVGLAVQLLVPRPTPHPTTPPSRRSRPRAANVWYSYSGNTAWPEMGNTGGRGPDGRPVLPLRPEQHLGDQVPAVLRRHPALRVEPGTTWPRCAWTARATS